VERPIQTYSELVELAQTCAKQAHFTKNQEVARELWRMAVEYQAQAAALGERPDLGPPPDWLKE